MDIPVFADVLEAQARIAPHVHRTPVLTSSQLNELTGAELFFKCENLQKVGAFKARGACNAVFSLSDDEAARGVAAHSSGNHAAALCYAAARRGIGATVVMPRNAPGAKKAAVRGYGGRIIESVSGSWTNVVGLPMEETAAALRRFGIEPGRRTSD